MSETIEKIKRVGELIVGQLEDQSGPAVKIPSKSALNVDYSSVRQKLSLGKLKTKRELFNVSQARLFMQTLLVAAGCKNLISQGKTLSIRGLYYMLKRSITNQNGVKLSENTFEDQGECDPIIEDLEVLIGSLREELHLYADKRGEMVGPITVIDRDDRIDCTRMGSGGYGIPSIVEPEIIQLDPDLCHADFVLHVEKGTVWQRFNEDKFWKKHNCILTHGAGQPPRGVRRMLYRLRHELDLPVYCLLDNDPWGYYIYSVIKQGSINLAHDSDRMSIYDARYIGLRARDFARCKIARNATIRLNEQDIKRAKQIANYPWFSKHIGWQNEISQLLDNGFKLEVEALISKDISYVTEHYVPELLADQDFLV